MTKAGNDRARKRLAAARQNAAKASKKKTTRKKPATRKAAVTVTRRRAIVQVNVGLDPELVEALEKAVARLGKTRVEIVSEALEAYFRRR